MACYDTALIAKSHKWYGYPKWGGCQRSERTHTRSAMGVFELPRVAPCRLNSTPISSVAAHKFVRRVSGSPRFRTTGSVCTRLRKHRCTLITPAPARWWPVWPQLSALTPSAKPKAARTPQRWKPPKVWNISASVAQLIGADPRNIAFGSTGTACWGRALTAMLRSQPLRIATVRNEWSANLLTALQLQSIGLARVTVCPTNTDGRFDLNTIEPVLSDVDVISVPFVSSISGMRNPIEKLAGLAKNKGILVMIDAAQAVGQLPVNVQACGVDILTFPAK